MKYFTLLLIPLFVFAAEGTLTPMQHNSIHGYNHKPTVKMQKKRNMHKIHKVDEKEVTEIVKNITKEDIKKMKLTHVGRILFYKIQTQNYSIKINAMDGSIIEKIKH